MTSLPQLVIPGLAMDEEAAFCEARRRWGNPAHVQVRQKLREGFNNIHEVAPQVCYVGVLFMVPTLPGEWGYPRSREDWHQYGEGLSWEEAFADADRSAHKRGGL